MTVFQLSDCCSIAQVRKLASEAGFKIVSERAMVFTDGTEEIQPTIRTPDGDYILAPTSRAAIERQRAHGRYLAKYCAVKIA